MSTCSVATLYSGIDWQTHGGLLATVLVTDGEQRAALAAVRSLGRAGHRVIVCAAESHSLAGASRYAARSIRIPSPLSDKDRSLDAVTRLIARERVEVLIPISEASLLAILPARAALQHVRIPFPDIADFKRISDKQVLMEEAAIVGICTPGQVSITSAREVPGEGQLTFPVVVKPSRSVVESDGTGMKTSVSHAADYRALLQIIGNTPQQAFPLLLQQRVVGPGSGVFLLMWDGAPIATMAHRRLREKPPSGGVSVYRESIPMDHHLLELSIRLLQRFNWQGPAMVEYKYDAATGTPYLMEVNGRFWGSLQLGMDAGVDFPALLVSAALGEEPGLPPEYRTGVRSRWWWGDVDHLLLRLRRSREELSLTRDDPGRVRAVARFLAACGPHARGEVLQWSDPLPAFRETIDWFRRR